MNPRFSIIVPLYNKAPYVKKALDSIVSQTFTDWECIIVDDGSTDNSAAICEEYLKNKFETLNLKLEIRILRQPNSGVAKARNVGVENSSAPFVCFLDADDWWEPEFLMTMAEAIEKCPDAGIYGVNYDSVRKGVVRKVVSGIKTGLINYFQAYSRPPYAMPLWTGAVVIPRKVYDEIGGFDPMLKMAEDFDLWTRIALKYPVYKLVDPKHHFVFHADYLLPEMEKNIDLQHAVDMVKIVCLRQYYLSRKYHQLAVDEMKKINIDQYRDAPFADYLWQPLWKERMKHYLYTLLTTMRNL